MKIGFVIGTLDFSGAEKIAKYLINELFSDGHEISVLLLSKESPYPGMEGIKQFPLYTKGNTLKRVLFRQKAIRDTVKKEEFDILISFGVKFNIDVMEALKSCNVKVILCERNDPYSDPHRKILRWRRRRIYKYANGYVFQTNTIAEYFGEKIAKKSAIIPNFIENKRSNEYEKSIDSRNIVITARLDDRQKNISMLLNAFNIFAQEYDYRLYIVGDGPDKARFEEYIQTHKLTDKAFLVGRQNVYDYLRIAEFFVLTSNYEGMPNSLIEAMAVGVPSISTDCSGGGASFLITDHINGTLIPVRDQTRLVDAMKELANSKELRSKYSFEAYKINDVLDFNRITEKWKKYIELVAKG